MYSVIGYDGCYNPQNFYCSIGPGQCHKILKRNQLIPGIFTGLCQAHFLLISFIVFKQVYVTKYGNKNLISV